MFSYSSKFGRIELKSVKQIHVIVMNMMIIFIATFIGDGNYIYICICICICR